MSKLKAKGPSKPLGRKPRGPDLRDARLEELDRDQLSIFFYLALPPEHAVALLKRLNLSITGFRPEGLGDIERSDLISDEFFQQANKKIILAALDEELAPLPAVESTLGPAAKVLGPLFAVEGGAAKAIARLLLDPDGAVRETGLEVLNALADYYLGEPLPPEEGGPQPGAEGHTGGVPGGRPPDPTEALRRDLQRAKERADQAEHDRQTRGDQLQQARREAAESQSALGEVRRMLAAAETDRDRLRASLQEIQAAPHTPAEMRLRKEVEEHKERIERLEEERRGLRLEETRLKHALSKVGVEPPPEPPKPAVDADDEVAEEAPTTWLMPVFTKEFYDSLPGWERRHQRAAFVKAMMLAQDHRRPSLRAIPLEGLDNLYRIRIATDVRLLYRRGEGNVIEILRLIDREDLERWIKVEKLRS